jgi:hypothetical protein
MTMAKSINTAIFSRIFSFLLLFSAATAVFGGGRQDADLTKADNLIKNNKYEEAISLLSNYAKKNPDKFELAQQRLRKIYQLQEEFNRTADKLIDTLLNDPDNAEKILALTKQLNSLESANSPLLENFVSRTHEIAQFNANRNRLADIFKRGEELLNKGDYAAAIKVYSEGMNFMRDDFFAAGYGASAENDVRRETERINTIIASFQQTSAQMGTIAAELARVINTGNLTGTNEIISRLNPALDRFIALKQDLYASDMTLTRVLGRIRERDPDMVDRNHVSFIKISINGRGEENIKEGMLGVFDIYWNNTIGTVITAITQNMQKMNTASLTAFNSKDYTAAVSSVSRGAEFSALSQQFFEKHRQFFAGGRPQTAALYGSNILREDLPQYLEIRALSEANNTLSQSANIGMRLSIDKTFPTRWRDGSITAAAALTGEQQTRSAITNAQNSLNTIRTNANRVNTEINAYYKTSTITNALAATDALNVQLQSEERQSAQRYYNMAYNSLQSNIAARKESLENSRKFLNGETRTANGVTTVFRYPTEALAELNTMLSALTADLQNGNNALAQLRNEPQTISSDPEISSLSGKYQAVINELTNIRTQAAPIMETARSSSTQAEAFRQEGERLFREAQTAFQRQNFDAARDRIQRASDRFNESLDIQESASLRQMRDTQLVNLGNQIAAAENEAIIAEVRNLLNNARTMYYNGNFQQAEDALTRARNRWRTTTSDNNEEIEYWFSLIRTAMSASSARVIPPTAPLYAEMSQLLGLAQKKFDEGTRFINAGQRSNGIARFDEARQLTRQVRLIFPVNQEAGILELRIEQFLDPAAFNASFEQRLRTAVAGTKQKSMEAFADLQNLAEINPRYPNIKAILTQGEIDIGIRAPPPNPANIARSRDLTASARRILESNTTAQYEVALAQLNEAISLNPNNTDAPQVRDRLLSRMSVPGSIVLSSADEADYQRALRELNANNILTALSLVERLMQNPRNRNMTKLVELQRRIQSAL